MKDEHHRPRWRAASGAIALVAGGFLTRAACAPVPLPAAPTAAAARAGQEARPVTAEDPPAPKAEPAAEPTAAGPTAPAPMSPRMTVPPPAAAMADRSLAVTEPRMPTATDAPAQAAPTSTGTAVPPLEKQELTLLASIERDLKREPPPEVHALLAEYRRGADRAALVSRVQREFPKDLQLRVTTLRWIDEVRPDPSRPSQGSSVPGQGTGSPWVRPIERR